MRDKAKFLDLLRKSLRVLPLIQQNIILAIQERIEDTDTLLDLGCGMKGLTRNLACRSLTGYDIWEDYLTSQDIRGDIMDLGTAVAEKAYDVVTALDVIEHLAEPAGYRMLEDMRRIARKRIFLLTPTEWSRNELGVIDPECWSFGNEFNYHRSHWTASRLMSAGLSLIGIDLNNELILMTEEVRA